MHIRGISKHAANSCRSTTIFPVVLAVFHKPVVIWMLLCYFMWQPMVHSFSLTNTYTRCQSVNQYTNVVSSSSFCSRCSVRRRPLTTAERRLSKTNRANTSLAMFLGQDAGFLGVGAPEIATIVIVGYFVLGPTELYKIVKDIGKFITNIRTVGAEATASFEGAMENQLALNEIRKAQLELTDAFSFRRSINNAEMVQKQQQSDRSNDFVASTNTAVSTMEATEANSNMEIPKKKKRRRVKRQVSAVEDMETMESGYPLMESSKFITEETMEETPEERKMRQERLARLEASLEESDRLWEKRIQEIEEEDESKLEGEFKGLKNSLVTSPQQQPSSRFLSQLSPEWNQSVMSNEDKLQPLAKIMEQLALLEEEREATLKRLEEEFRRKNETETLFYEKKRDLLKSAASEIQQHFTTSSEK
jgi:hypothetical protein